MRNVKIFAIIFILLFVASYSMAQGVAINTDGATADGSAMLDVKSTSSGMLIPRMSLAQRNSLTLPAHSLLIYQTDNTPGYYYNSGTPASPVWERLATGSSVDGSGAATRVAFWTGTTTLGSNANLYWDNTNGRLGIGVTSPGSKLEILQNMSDYTTAFTGAHLNLGAGNTVDNTGFVGITYDASTAANYGWSSGALRSSGSQSDFVWKHHNNSASGTEWMRITSTGNLGIGTTAPSAKLHVNGTIRFQSYPSGANGAIVRTDASGNIAITNFTGSTSNVLLGNNTFGSISDAGGVVSSCGTANYVPKMTSSTTMSCSQIFDNGTNVGIARTDPAQKLDVVGRIRSSDPSYSTSRWIDIYSSSAQLIETTNDLYIGTTGVSAIHLQPGRIGSSNGSVHIRNNAGTNWASFDGVNQRLGVGTSSPTTKLDVIGTAKASAFAQNCDGLRIVSPDGAAYATSTSSVTGAIKITLPQYRSSTMMRMTVKIYQYTTDKSYTIELGGYNYVAGSWYNTFANISTRFGDNLTVRFGHDGTNNCIWIGEITSVWSYPQVFVTEFQAGYSNYSIEQWDNGWDVSFVTSFNTVEATANSAYTPSGTGTPNYLAKWITSSTLGIGSVYDNGNVGIGTTSPGYKLHTVGDIYANGGWMRVSGNQGLYFESWGGGFYMVDGTWIRTYNNKSFYHNTGIMRTDGTFQVGDAGGTLNVPNGGNFAYRTNVLFANTAGNVGIGTTAPDSKLHVINGATSSDAGAVRGIQNNTDYYGIGGIFQGGYMAVNASVYPTGANTYYGIYSVVSGGSGSNYGVYSSASGGKSIGLLGLSNSSNGFGVYASNSHTSGTGLIAGGNNTASLTYLTTGSGIAGTGTDGVLGYSSNASGTGVIGTGNNSGIYTLVAGSGVAGSGTTVGVYGYTNSASGAGVLGQNGNSSGWAGDFQGRTKIGTATTDTHDFWGTIKCATTSDSHIIRPNAGNWSYVGNSTYYWYYIYSNNFVDPSQRSLKRDIMPIRDNLDELVMNDIERIQPSFYKYIGESDEFEKGNEYKYRPNYHIGVILDESPDYIQDNAFSGIDLYGLATMSLVGVKYNYKEIKKLKSTISDFGSVSIYQADMWIYFSEDFSDQIIENIIPIITVTSNKPEVSLSVLSKSNKGFRIYAVGDISDLQVDWIAMAKVDPELCKLSEDKVIELKNKYNLIVSDNDKQKLKSWIESEDQRLNELNPAINSDSYSKTQIKTSMQISNQINSETEEKKVIVK